MASRAEVAAALHAHLCAHPWHGYTQGPGRWGDGEGDCVVTVGGRTYGLAQGDRDCSSSVIDCWARAIEGTPWEGALDAATYTGDMRRVFVASGLFSWHPMGDGYVARRGDVYLNERDHTAMCQSAVPDALSEFAINELGGIVGGQVGDQTGAESRIAPYYDYPWDGVLAYNGLADEAGEDDDMAFTDEDRALLRDVHKQLTRTDTAGHDNEPGHDMFGMLQIIRRQLTRTDAEGHAANKGHDFLGTLGLIYGKLCDIAKDVKAK